MLTHVPLQQRCAAVVPHDAPLARVVCTHLLSTHVAVRHELEGVQSLSITHSGGGASIAASTGGDGASISISFSASITTPPGGPPQKPWMHAWPDGQ
jgi:hypothetical protein